VFVFEGAEKIDAAVQKKLEMLRCSMHIGVRNSQRLNPHQTPKGPDQWLTHKISPPS
jgi:hypothetical protein